jgi:hypothetical protein
MPVVCACGALPPRRTMPCRGTGSRCSAERRARPLIVAAGLSLSSHSLLLLCCRASSCPLRRRCWTVAPAARTLLRGPPSRRHRIRQLLPCCRAGSPSSLLCCQASIHFASAAELTSQQRPSSPLLLDRRSSSRNSSRSPLPRCRAGTGSVIAGMPTAMYADSHVYVYDRRHAAYVGPRAVARPHRPVNPTFVVFVRRIRIAPQRLLPSAN